MPKPPTFDLSSSESSKGKAKSKEIAKLKSKSETISLLEDELGVGTTEITELPQSGQEHNIP